MRDCAKFLGKTAESGEPPRNRTENPQIKSRIKRHSRDHASSFGNSHDLVVRQPLSADPLAAQSTAKSRTKPQPTGSDRDQFGLSPRPKKAVSLFRPSWCSGGFRLIVSLVSDDVSYASDRRWSPGCLVAVAVPVLFFAAYIYYIQVVVPRPFTELLESYSSLEGSSPISEELQPYLRGKVAAIDVTNNRMAAIWQELPRDVRASNSDDTVTIIVVRENEQVIGTYGCCGKAIVLLLEISIIDRSIPAVILSRKVFRGSDPPNTSTAGNTQRGSSPHSDVVTYLRSLPRK